MEAVSVEKALQENYSWDPVAADAGRSQPSPQPIAVAQPRPGASPEPLVSAVYEKLGGRNTLGTDVSGYTDLARMVLQRIPLQALVHVQRSGLFSESDIQNLIIPARTRRRRAKNRERLSIEESDRLVRLTRLHSVAEGVFRDAGRAHRWLRKELDEFNASPPLRLARTEAGARAVEQLLSRFRER